MLSLNVAEAKVPPDAAEAEQKVKLGDSVVEASWGALRLEPRQVRDILSKEDGLLDA